MKKSRTPTAVPLQGTVHVRGCDVFGEPEVQKVVQASGKSAVKCAVWVAEALNDATNNFYSNFALSRIGVPSEQAKWAANLKTAVETCLRMLAPEIPVTERPRVADHRVYSALFHMSAPDDLPSKAEGSAAAWGHGPIRGTLDAIPGALWDLRRMADVAEQGWRAAIRSSKGRKQPDTPIISWIADLGNVYERALDARMPTSPREESAFVRFADAARLIALTADVTEHGTDEEARRRLKELTPSRLCSYAREHRADLEVRRKQARDAEYIPYRIKLGIVTVPEPRVGNQPPKET
jgi:hypothetical protein